MKLRKYTTSIILWGLLSCSPTYTLESYQDRLVAVDLKGDSTILAMISPYKNSIKAEMEEILCYTKNDLKKGKPESTIGNFVTDLCLDYAEADICVLNNGGLRTQINKGNITKGQIYELMPFDNELVILEIGKDDFMGLLDYITKRGGEPFSGMKITINHEGELINNLKINDKVRVITSDYLANGGDKMWFFNNKKQQKTGVKVRDAIIDYCSKNDTIDIKLDQRIKL